MVVRIKPRCVFVLVFGLVIVLVLCLFYGQIAYRNLAARFDNAKIQQLIDKVEQEHESCLQVFKTLKNEGTITHSDSLFGLSPDCLHSLSGKHLIRWPKYGESTRQDYTVPHCFRRAIKESDKTLFTSNIQFIQQLFDMKNIEYFLNGESLISSMRHLGLAPWDENIEIMMNYEHRNQAWEVLTHLKSVGLITTNSTAKNAKTPLENEWKTCFQFLVLPYWENNKCRFCLNINFFTRKNEKIEYLRKSKEVPTGSIEDKEVFPLNKRPFESMNLPVPRNIDAWLANEYVASAETIMSQCEYPKSVCNPNSTTVCSKPKMRCEDLKMHYPFANSFELRSGGTLELLTQNTKAFRAVYIP